MRLWMILASLLVCLASTVAVGARASSMNLYVAQDGSDGWSGRRAAPNRAKTDGPYATLERARDAIRALKKAGKLPEGGVTVWIRGGLYSRARTFALTAED